MTHAHTSENKAGASSFAFYWSIYIYHAENKDSIKKKIWLWDLENLGLNVTFYCVYFKISNSYFFQRQYQKSGEYMNYFNFLAIVFKIKIGHYNATFFWWFYDKLWLKV